MRLVILALIAGAAWAQDGAPVRISSAPAPIAYTIITHYTAGNAPDYICKAPAFQPTSTITVSAISNANLGSMTATAHGFYYSTSGTQKIAVWISGLTGNWTPLNGFHVLTPTSANALATDVDTTAFGALAGTIVVSTHAPKATATIWSLQAWVPDASNNILLQAWAVPTATSLANLGSGSTAFIFACAAPTVFQ